MSEASRNEWENRQLSELAQIVSGGTPSRLIPEFWNNGTIPWVTPTDISHTQGRFLCESAEMVTALGLASSSARRLPPGTLLMTSRATLGEIRIAAIEVCTNQGFKSLIPKNDVAGEFLYYQLLHNRERYKLCGIGSTFLEVSKRDTARFAIDLPTLIEQRRIAEILGTVDEAIEQTDALIAKQQQVKAGLMHDLFTRGLWTKAELDRGAHKGLPSEASAKEGQLRPTRAEAPELYHETPLGWLPKEWDADKLGNMITGIDAGWSPDCIETPPQDGEWGVLKVSAVTGGVFRAKESKTLPTHLRPLPELEVKVGDVITARANGVAELVGVTVQVHECRPGLMLSDKLLRLCPNQRAIGSFLAGVMATHSTRQQIDSLISGSSGQRNIGQGQIRNLLTPCPSIHEQKLMELVSQSVESVLTAETSHLAKLRQLKQGLMQVLLTPPQ